MSVPNIADAVAKKLVNTFSDYGKIDSLFTLYFLHL